MEDERKRLDGEVEERVKAVQRIADKNEDDKIVFQGEKHSIWIEALVQWKTNQFNECHNYVTAIPIKTFVPEFEDLMKDKAKRDFIDRALDLNKVRGWSYDTPWLKEEWEKEKK